MNMNKKTALLAVALLSPVFMNGMEKLTKLGTSLVSVVTFATAENSHVSKQKAHLEKFADAIVYKPDADSITHKYVPTEILTNLKSAVAGCNRDDDELGSVQAQVVAIKQLVANLNVDSMEAVRSNQAGSVTQRGFAAQLAALNDGDTGYKNTYKRVERAAEVTTVVGAGFFGLGWFFGYGTPQQRMAVLGTTGAAAVTAGVARAMDHREGNRALGAAKVAHVTPFLKSNEA